MKKNILIFFLLALVAGILSCSKNGKEHKVRLSKTESLATVRHHFSGEPVRIAVGSMITPREGFAYYKKLLTYISEKLDRKVEFVDREDYAEVNKLLKEGSVDVAFVCGGPYVSGHREFGLELLVAPFAYGGTVYYSYIIAHRDSPAKDFADLRGKTFAFTDPLSNSGKLVPTYMLAKMNETPETFFKSFDFTYAHDRSIRAVADGVVDGAAVDSLIWEYINRTNPQYTSRTKIIKKSQPYGIPPVAVRPGLDKKLKEELRQIFLNIYKDEEGKAILKGMMIEKFVPVEDSQYDSIRAMKQWIAQKGINKT